MCKGLFHHFHMAFLIGLSNGIKKTNYTLLLSIPKNFETKDYIYRWLLKAFVHCRVRFQQETLIKTIRFPSKRNNKEIRTARFGYV